MKVKESGELMKRGNSYCGCFAVYQGRHGEYWRSRCGLRGCLHKECRKKYAKKRISELTALCEKNELRYFFSLTLDPKKFGTVRECWDQISYVWSKARKCISRKYPEIRWVAILEKHKKNDRPHIHGFCDVRMDVVWLREVWKNSGGGPQMKLEYVRGSAVDYVCKELAIHKYVGKDNVNIADYVRPGQRIIWKSYNLQKSPKKKTEGVGFVVTPKIFGFSGKKMLTDQEIWSTINENIRTKHKGDQYYEEKQEWTYLEGTFTVLPAKSTQDGCGNLASYGRRPEGNASSEKDKGSEKEVKRADPKTDRQITFFGKEPAVKNWKEYHNETEQSEKQKTVEVPELKEGFHPLCRLCPLQQKIGEKQYALAKKNR